MKILLERWATYGLNGLITHLSFNSQHVRKCPLSHSKRLFDEGQAVATILTNYLCPPVNRRTSDFLCMRPLKASISLFFIIIIVIIDPADLTCPRPKHFKVRKISRINLTKSKLKTAARHDINLHHGVACELTNTPSGWIDQQPRPNI